MTQQAVCPGIILDAETRRCSKPLCHLRADSPVTTPQHPLPFPAHHNPAVWEQIDYMFTFYIYPGRFSLHHQRWRHFKRQKPGKAHCCSGWAPSTYPFVPRKSSLCSDTTNHDEIQTDTKGTNSKKLKPMCCNIQSSQCVKQGMVRSPWLAYEIQAQVKSWRQHKCCSHHI